MRSKKGIMLAHRKYVLDGKLGVTPSSIHMFLNRLLEMSEEMYDSFSEKARQELKEKGLVLKKSSTVDSPKG